MNEENFDEIFRYLTEQGYSERLKDRKSKKAFRRSCKGYSLQDGRLYDVEEATQNRLGKARLVVRGKKEMERVFLECHQAQYGGHVSRDNTLAKIRERYFWPGFYNNTANMVS